MERKLQLKDSPDIQDRVSQNSKMKLNLLRNYNTIIWSSSWDAAFRERKDFWCMNICQIRAWTFLSLIRIEQLWLIGINDVKGIAQGLLYLHKHSRLRIRHRDLIKASNILLDQDMNPKISDFGLAKNFSSNDTQGNTNRVVGTYGYMSPEYAYKEIYSIKSDVFSFGVLLLEILSGKRNSGFHKSEDFINLLGYSWQLWECGRYLELLEASIVEIHPAEARRFIHIVLMCVQENADDRLTTSNAVAMLNNENVILPDPNHPAYFSLRVPNIHESATAVVPCSNNDVTITEQPDGR
nr:G-type lectin S-receptor-like serine/threonine-protein kinase At4g03230 [Aegilops tauschii subsp. strangulata]